MLLTLLLAQNDLYTPPIAPNPSSPGTNPSSPATINTVLVSELPNSGNRGLLSTEGLDNFLAGLTQGVNIYVLALSLFISFVLIADFYFYYVVASNNELDREIKGETRLWQAWNVWVRYFSCWLLLFVAASFQGAIATLFNILTILAFIFKVTWDFKALLFSSDYFDWYTGILQGLQNSAGIGNWLASAFKSSSAKKK